MNIAIIIQARMESSRLPNKVLKKINDKPLLEYLIEQIRIKNDGLPIIIATSRSITDEKIIDYCTNNDIEFYQGSFHNVASRFFNIIKINNLDYFIRICADSPLFDGDLIRKSVDLIDNELDLITNIYPRTFPKGQSVEIIKSKTFKNIFRNFFKKSHFEHVTNYFYENIDNFKIKSLINNTNMEHVNLAVDTKADFKNVKNIIYKMKKPHYKYSFEDLLKL
ncbi:MAG: hypothetical protein CMG55_08730 [Candidatus Marinimicrobia bacterium]|nr:hypothetical protein [Candidatus Neomarinimicrobiota bacterium]|tara:strand:- start:832 stop:1497 length:666 start_codon:yes stop_codon:yes gene_type:complete